MQTFAIILVAWGEPFINLLTRFCLPSLLAPGNLPAWPNCADTRLVLYTPAEDWAPLENARVVEKIRQHIGVETVPIEVAGMDKYDRLTRIHRLALQQAAEKKESVILLMPDVVLVNGSLQALARELETDGNVLLSVGPRVCLETFAAEVPVEAGTGAITLEPERGVDLFVKHMHPINRSQSWNGEDFTQCPSNIWVWKDSQTLEFRCLHLHPFFIRSPLPFTQSHDTIDGSYLQEYFSRGEKIKVIDDPRILLLSLTPADESTYCLPGPVPWPEKQVILDRFAREKCHPVHHWSFQHPITLVGSQRKEAPSSEAALALQGLEIYWQIEAHSHEKNDLAVIALFETHRNVLRQTLRIPYFYFYLYYVAAAHYRLQQWEALKTCVKAHKTALRALFSLQLAYRLPRQSAPVPEDYALIFLDQPALSAEMVSGLPSVSYHVFIDETHLGEQGKTEEFYALLSLPAKPLILPRRSLESEALINWLSKAAEIVVPDTGGYRDIVIWGMAGGKAITLY